MEGDRVSVERACIGVCCYCKNQGVAYVNLIGQCIKCVETRYLQVFP